MKKAKGKKKTKKTGQLSLLNIKVTKADREEMAPLAKEFTNGNISAWLRLAGKYYRPDKDLFLKNLYRLSKPSR